MMTHDMSPHSLSEYCLLLFSCTGAIEPLYQSVHLLLTIIWLNTFQCRALHIPDVAPVLAEQVVELSRTTGGEEVARVPIMTSGFYNDICIVVKGTHNSPLTIDLV